MHPSRTALTAASLWLALAVPFAPPARVAAQTSDPLAEARRRLDRNDALGAVGVLEPALHTLSAAQRPAALGLMKRAYDEAARAAEKAGRHDQAEEYRDNLAILERSSRQPATRRPPEPSTGETAPDPRSAESRGSTATKPSEIPLPSRPMRDSSVDRAVVDAPALTEPSAQLPVEPLPAVAAPGRPAEVLPPVAGGEPSSTTPTSPSPRETAPPALAPAVGEPRPGGPDSRSVAVAEAPASTPPQSAASGPGLGTADAAFTAKKYDVAGPIYAELARRNALPPDRRDHWAYCRAVEVVRRINARPTSAAEWTAIDTEIEKIRQLSPTNWFAEYLRNRAAERNPGARASQGQRVNNKVVVRGSSPEEEPRTPPPVRSLTPRPGSVTPAPAHDNAPSGAPSPTSSNAPATPHRWAAQPLFTANFQVIYPEGQEATADQVGKAAETARATLMKRWGEATPGLPWTPRCEILLFATAEDYSKATGQPPESPGISTMRMTEGRIDGRRVNLRLDHSGMLKAVLPHEVTHVVLADLFPHKQIPRWADEGMAVLSEPTSEQNLRSADLEEPLASGRLFRINDLVTMDYPDPAYLSLYYAQSVSLTRFLVQQGSPAQFLKFVQQAQWSGFEPALQQIYEIRSVAELQTRWLTFARSQTSRVGEVAASNTTADATRE